MRNRLPKTSHHISICEANFLRLSRILMRFEKDHYFFESAINNNNYQHVSFLVLDRTKHTICIEAKSNDLDIPLNSFTLRINVFLDAEMVEVSSYQSEKPLPFFYKKSVMQSKDEKEQQNRFLTEWLESIFNSGLVPKNIIKNIINE